MSLYHTSPNIITEINKEGLFESFLCFSDEIYIMTAGNYFTYEIEIEENSLINSFSIFSEENSYALCKPFIDQVCSDLGCDEETAINLLSEKIDLLNTDLNWSSEMSWKLQLLSGKCARALGYRGVILNDEQGALYLIDMFKKEDELKIS